MNITDRIENRELQKLVRTPEEAAALIKPGMTIGTSGFTSAGYPKAVPLALAERIKKEKFKINLWTGASVGPELDGALSAVNGIAQRLPYQTNSTLRQQINAGDVQYEDLHLSHMSQMVRSGFFQKLDMAIVEVCAVTEEGYLIPTTSLGNTTAFVDCADRIIVEVNTTQPKALKGFHDVYDVQPVPHRDVIPIVHPDDRVGVPYIVCDPKKIAAIVPCDIPDKPAKLAPPDAEFEAMSAHLIRFLHEEVAAGRLPKHLLPLQSGVGSVANAVIQGLCRSDFEHLTVYTEVIQEGIFDLFDAGKLDFASGTSMTLSEKGLQRFYDRIDEYRKKIIFRPLEISNSPGVIRRLGVIAMNTALEFDIYGNVNSTHVLGTKIMNGIGGSGDFARNAYLTFFFTKSIAKNGDISSIVPMCSHIDHTEHDVDVFVTEQGLADVRGLCPKERALKIIHQCAHPDYRPMLSDYFQRAMGATKHANTPHILSEALSWHQRFAETKTMRV